MLLMKIDVITEIVRVLFKYIVVVYLFVGAYYFINLPSGGDESLFVCDLQLIKNIGWEGAIVKNISIPYMILTYPLSLFMEDFVALRVANIVLFLVLLCYFYYSSKIKVQVFYCYILFFSSTVGYFYIGTNDSLFFVALIIFLNEVTNAVNNKNKNFNLALSALVIAFFTRQLFLVYLPIILIGLFILYKHGSKFTIKSFVPLGIFVLFILLNIPSIEKNGSLSFDKKSPPDGLKVSWSQRQYLAQLMVNDGELANGQHPSWEVAKQYLDKNGKESLPDGILNGITFNYQLTIKEFFKDFAYSMIYSFRSLGFMLLFALGYWFKGIYKSRKIEYNYFVPLATLMMLMIFSFIIISYVELRWLIPVFVMTIVYYSQIEQQNKISKYFILANYLVLCLFAVYGIFRIFNKI